MSPATIEAVFDRARAIADAVLWEGYVLYPYRRSAAKNRIRFQWGVVGPAEQPTMTSSVLLQPATARVHLRIRFLHLHRRDDGWDEAVAVDHDVAIDVDHGVATSITTTVDVPAGAGGRPLHGSLTVTCTPDDGMTRLTAHLENRAVAVGGRGDALLESFVGCHLLFAATEDAFVSLLEPPDGFAAAASRCAQHRCWPVLVGPEPRRDLVLASPVILYDYPTVSPQSAGDFFDGTEIDEMLTLRVQTLTDDEKAEARATDPRAAAIIDRVETMSEDVMASLHGGTQVSGPVDPMPEWSDPGRQSVSVGGVEVTRGSKVVLRPSRRADIHDMFVIGRTATVAEVVNDVDGDVHLAVLIDDDPASELMDTHGRFRYFAPDEVEPYQLSQSLETRSLDSDSSLATSSNTSMSPELRSGAEAVTVGPDGPPPATGVTVSTGKILVAGVGNIFQSDDGFGSAVIARLLEGDVPDGATIVDYGIRGIHLAFDLADGVGTLILVDTVPEAGGPGAVSVMEVPADSFATGAFDAHDLDPNSVFRSLGALAGSLPRTLVVGCQPVTIEDGIGLSDPVAAAVPHAADNVLQLLRELGGSP